MQGETLVDVTLLQCPITGEALVETNGELISSKARYERCGGHWNLCPPIEIVYPSELARIWEELQYNGTVSYDNAPKTNLGVGKRDDYIAFGKFSSLEGRVLDVGVGPQTSPTHLEYSSNRNFDFYGVDPLLGEEPKAFKFIRGYGEKLPFKSDIFDRVLFVTSLDHFLNPVLALKEATRVLNAAGDVCIWIGEKSKFAPKPAVSPDWYTRLKTPSGAEDPFHYKRFSLDECKQYIQEARLSITEFVFTRVGEYRVNHFIKCKKNEDYFK